jgi:hypothetical protein
MTVKPTAGENKKATVPVSSTEANNASLQHPDMSARARLQPIRKKRQPRASLEVIFRVQSR